MATRPRLFIIDTMALIYRSFFALGGGGGGGTRMSLTTSQGLPTGAIFGSALFLTKLITEQRPDFLVAVTDSEKPTFRDALYPEYKATRERMPDDLGRQIPHVFDLLEKLKIPLITVDGVEADDVIGTLACRFAGDELDVFIVSGDKDFMQVVSDHIFMYAPKKNEEAQIVDIAAVREKFHCTPAQVIDALALIGDTVDNVPGVAGIGEKTAAKLIETYGSLDGIYANLDKITATKQRETLAASRSVAYLSRQLVTLKTDVPVATELNDLRLDPKASLQSPELLALYQQFEFKSLAQKVAQGLSNATVQSGTAAVNSKDKATTPAASTSSQAAHQASTAMAVTNETELKSLRAAIAAAPYFAFAIDASGTDIIADRATEIAIACSEEQRFSLRLDEAGTYRARSILADKSTTKITHGWKTACEMLINLGIDVAGTIVDLEICDYLIDPNSHDHSVESLANRHLRQSLSPSSPLELPPLYLQLQEKLAPQIAALGLVTVLHDIEMPLVPVLAAMEREGIYIDADFLGIFSDELAVEAKRLETSLYAAAGGPFNINSSKQLQELLFDRLKLQEAAGLKRLKRTKTGFSTDESVLERLADVNPVPRLILEYRGIMKLKNTYVDPLPQFINPRTQRVHTSFRQTVAATGRLSCDQPNLQNIPMRTAMGRKIRAAFRPQNPDDVFISADYSQVEIRLLAHLAKAEVLIEAFKHGLDVHTVTAARIFGLKESEVSSELRSRAKAINFGIIYGMGAQRLAAQTGVTLLEAKDFIKRYFEVYPGIKHYTEGLIEFARTHGYCVTIMGRRRPIPEIRDRNKGMAVRGENIAVNAPIQGSAADLIKLAMIRVQQELKIQRLKTRMLLQVHDELVFSAPLAEVDSVIPVIREQMEHALQTSVPLKVDIRSGKTWLEAH